MVLAGILFFFSQKLACGPGLGGGAGAGPNGGPGGENLMVSAPLATSGPHADTQSRPLEITIDDTRYLVEGTPVESVDALVKRAAAVPKDVPPPRVRIVHLPTARYSAEKKLDDALEAASIDFIDIKRAEEKKDASSR